VTTIERGDIVIDERPRLRETQLDREIAKVFLLGAGLRVGAVLQDPQMRRRAPWQRSKA
jgi:hypothetical protein